MLEPNPNLVSTHELNFGKLYSLGSTLSPNSNQALRLGCKHNLIISLLIAAMNKTWVAAMKWNALRQNAAGDTRGAKKMETFRAE